MKIKDLWIRISEKVFQNRTPVDKLIKKNKKLNYKLIKYVWYKNCQIKDNINHSCTRSNKTYLDSLSPEVALQPENSIDLNELLNQIVKQPKKKYIRKGLKILYTSDTLYNKYNEGSMQRELVVRFIKQNITKILSKGRLKKTKITKKEQADKLIEQNKKVLNQLEKLEENIEIKKLISGEIKNHINNIYTTKKNTQEIQKKVDEVKDIMCVNIKKVIERGPRLSVLKEKAESLEKTGEEFLNSTKKVVKKDKTFLLCYTLAAVIITIALICCIFAILNDKLPSKSLDHITLTQKEFTRSLT